MAKRMAIVVIPIVLVALVVAPLALDQPFGAQTPWKMALIFTLRRWSPVLSVIGLVATIGLLPSLWRESRRWPARLGLTAAAIAAAGVVWFARQNPFEWMFKPLPRPAFVSARDARAVADADLVLAVTIDGDAAAYPIRQMAYHHLVNDRIGRTPAVVTY